MSDERAVVKNAASTRQVRRADLGDQIKGEQIDGDIAAILTTRSGRRFVWRYLGICGVFQSSFGDQLHMAYMEGHRNVGLMLMADVMRVHPDAYVLMSKEAQADAAAIQAENEGPTDE